MHIIYPIFSTTGMAFARTILARKRNRYHLPCTVRPMLFFLLIYSAKLVIAVRVYKFQVKVVPRDNAGRGLHMAILKSAGGGDHLSMRQFHGCLNPLLIIVQHLRYEWKQWLCSLWRAWSSEGGWGSSAIPILSDPEQPMASVIWMTVERTYLWML
ncbi:hypothetical protein BJV82DRAFT_265952 [Fennellomyces sp. T-0311]|nr:hypothetical protein BJV82DRAFT_265952 [Fennellomyces sp. T-0311]